MLAARGPGPRPRKFPWGDEGMRGNVRAPRLEELTAAAAFEHYLANAAAVDAHPDSASREGVLELFGNVDEWTASLGIDVGPSGLVLRPGYRIVVGHDFRVMTRLPEADLGITRLVPTGPTQMSPTRGFRCARSVPR
jgi:hypothetical protein